MIQPPLWSPSRPLWMPPKAHRSGQERTPDQIPREETGWKKPPLWSLWKSRWPLSWPPVFQVHAVKGARQSAPSNVKDRKERERDGWIDWEREREREGKRDREREGGKRQSKPRHSLAALTQGSEIGWFCKTLANRLLIDSIFCLCKLHASTPNVEQTHKTRDDLEWAQIWVCDKPYKFQKSDNKIKDS